MDANKIEDEEILYRMVKKSLPDGFINNQPTAALFMDKRGASVDRGGERTSIEVIEKFKNRFKEEYQATVQISALMCREAETYPNPVGNGKNKYHAEIHDSKDEQYISLFKAIKLAQFCEIVKA